MKYTTALDRARSEAPSVVPLCAAAFTIPPVRLRDLMRAEREAKEAKTRSEGETPKRDEKSEG